MYVIYPVLIHYLFHYPFIYKSIIISFTLYPHVEKSICIHAAEVTFKKALLKQIKNDTFLWNGIQVFVKEKKKTVWRFC